MSVAIASVRRWLWLALLLPLLGATGCIEFERQTMTFHYDLPTDELRIFQVYEGIYADTTRGATPSEGEMKELASVFGGERTFFFSNWIAEFDREKLTEQLKTLEAAPLTEGERVVRPLQLALGQQALASFKVANGRFYRNGQGQLCGYQMVTIAHASKLAAAGNALLSAGAQEPQNNWLLDWPEDAQQRVREAAAKQYQWVRLQGDELSVHLPITHAYYLEQRRHLLPAVVDDPAEALKNPPPAPPVAPPAAPDAHPAPADDPGVPIDEATYHLLQVLANDVQLYYAAGEAVFTLGDRDNAETTLTLTVNPGKYTPNAIPLAQTHGGIADTVDLAALRAAFLHPKP